MKKRRNNRLDQRYHGTLARCWLGTVEKYSLDIDKLVEESCKSTSFALAIVLVAPGKQGAMQTRAGT